MSVLPYTYSHRPHSPSGPGKSNERRLRTALGLIQANAGGAFRHKILMALLYSSD